MCRGNEYHDFHDRREREGDRLNIRGFRLRLSVSHADHSEPLPETLTLVYFPRVVDDLSAAAYVALHRVRPTGPGWRREAVYASADRVRVGSGARFEIYVGGERVLKGGFRPGCDGGWRLGCECAAEGGEVGGFSEAEVQVAAEAAEGPMREKVEMRRRRRRSVSGLEEIPEEEEEGLDGCDCECGGEWEMVGSSDGWDEEEVEGLSWAVDLGIGLCVLGWGFWSPRLPIRPSKGGSRSPKGYKSPLKILSTN
ncbi:hypothetical protein QJS10_CPB17g01661 [Acorus calamus]|uniref:Uncharacterized protein n=1 Tax=Acorus calamus TaxID=4465 RepID=A0AAV9CWG3_ACOCL|nr:hypothetical protein QJS10_CPB17g01661 [Acorus calamus]